MLRVVLPVTHEEAHVTFSTEGVAAAPWKGPRGWRISG